MNEFTVAITTNRKKGGDNMAKTKSVRVEYGRTVQTAPYESMKFSVAIEKDLASEDNVKIEIEKTANGMAKYVKTLIKQQLETM